MTIEESIEHAAEIVVSQRANGADTELLLMVCVALVDVCRRQQIEITRLKKITDPTTLRLTQDVTAF